MRGSPQANHTSGGLQSLRKDQTIPNWRAARTSGGIWGVAELFGYPLEFPQRYAREMREGYAGLWMHDYSTAEALNPPGGTENYPTGGVHFLWRCRNPWE